MILHERSHGDTLIEIVYEPDELPPVCIRVTEPDGASKVLVPKDGKRAMEMFRRTHRYVDWETALRVFS